MKELLLSKVKALDPSKVISKAKELYKQVDMDKAKITFGKYADMIVFGVLIIIVIGMMLNMGSIASSSSKPDIADKFTESVECTVTSAEIKTNDTQTKYITVLTYLDEDYTFSDKDTYLMCYNKVDKTVDGELVIKVYEDGSVEYEITGLYDDD